MKDRLNNIIVQHYEIILLAISCLFIIYCIFKSFLLNEICSTKVVICTFASCLAYAFGLFYKKQKSFEYLWVFVVLGFFLFTNWNIVTTGFEFHGYFSNWDYGDIGEKEITAYANSSLFDTNYPPLAVGIYKLFYLFQICGDEAPQLANNYIVFIYLLVCIAIMTVSIVNIFRQRLGTKHPEIHVLTLFFSGPILYSIGRSNLSLLALAMLFFFVSYYDHRDKGVRFVAYLALALSANIKLYPAAFGILLLKREYLKRAFICFFMGLGLFLTPFIFKASNVYEFFLLAERLLKSNFKWATSAKSLKGVSLSLPYRIRKSFPIFANNSLYMLLIIIVIFIFAISITAALIADNDEQKCLMAAFLCITIPTISLWYSVAFLAVPFVLHICRYNIENRVWWLTKLGIYLLLMVYLYGGRGLWNWFPYGGYWRIIVLWLANLAEIAYKRFFFKRKNM